MHLVDHVPSMLIERDQMIKCNSQDLRLFDRRYKDIVDVYVDVDTN